MTSYQLASVVGRRARAARLRRLLRGKLVLVAAGAVVALVVLAAVFAPLIAPYDPNAVDPMAVSQGSSAAHWLGTDDTGRDIASRLLHGARPSLLAPLVVTVGAGLVGTALAVAAAWLGGWWDRAITAVLDVVFGFPGLVLAVVGAAVFGAGLKIAVLTLTIAYLPYVARVVRGSALKERNLPYVAALRMLGLGGGRIVLRHVVPNLLPLVLVQTATAFGYTLLDVAAFSFIGLGAQPPTAEWGLMVAQGAPGILAGAPQESLYAGLAIVVFVVACSLLGAGLSQRLTGGER
ncbi:ABC transporter permease [Streptacidiphilus jiangxiensis]|uniref:Peptide/nickel transport system permease protein n=1 Tax=Streptacidiphilus jiangxiensis TaxID=235985 RepID=A0A1H7HEL0_STRJI|nr:ABC transporter permease [Streptacidiphilus jiangxiensis]SEK48674.1 peptide/nickel transport system permease protein [Streptacidiphilus jiangxiensis]